MVTVKNITITKVWEWECRICGSNGYEPTAVDAIERAKLHNEANHKGQEMKDGPI